jgi:hypothetical protein
LFEGEELGMNSESALGNLLGMGLTDDLVVEKNYCADG